MDVIIFRVGYVYPRPRPFVVLNIPHLLAVTSPSFPSGHTIFVFSIATVLFFYYRPLGYFAYASGLMIGLAWIMPGVHYPSDVLAGMVLGIAVGAAVTNLTQRVPGLSVGTVGADL
jgi:undecaprenyl-diphosphatase